MRSYSILLLFTFNLLFISFAQSQNSNQSVTKEKFTPEFRIKLNSKIFLGELPLEFEYRIDKNIGIDLSLNYVYLSLVPGSRKLQSNGYKASIGVKKYFRENLAKKRTFYIHSNLFYKEINSDDRFYTSDGLFGFCCRGGSPYMYSEYFYNLNRKVIALSILAGWNLNMKYHIFEIYFGAGYRQIEDNRDITKWITKKRLGDTHIFPNEKQVIKYYPSFHFGFCWSFDLNKLLFKG